MMRHEHLICNRGHWRQRFAKNDAVIGLDEPRTRLRKMSDEELLRFGKPARFMCRDKSPRDVFVIQLEEARANGDGGTRDLPA